MAAPAAVGEIKGLHLLFEKVSSPGGAPAPAAAGAQEDPKELYADSYKKLYRINGLELVKVNVMGGNLTDVTPDNAHISLKPISESVITGKGYTATESVAVKEARVALRILQRELGGEGGGLRGGLAEAIERLERCCPPVAGVGGAQPPAGGQPPPPPPPPLPLPAGGGVLPQQQQQPPPAQAPVIPTAGMDAAQVVGLMNAAPGNVAVVEAGVEILKEIAKDEAGRNVCVTAGAPAAVVTVLNAQPDADVFIQACDFMLNLAGSDAGKDALVTAGAVPRLVEGIDDWAKQHKAHHTLLALGYDDRGVKVPVGGGGGGSPAAGSVAEPTPRQKLLSKIDEIENKVAGKTVDNLLDEFKPLLNEHIISIIQSECQNNVEAHYDALMDKKIFDNDTLTSQEKLDEIYVMVKDLHGGAIEKDDLMKAIEESYIPVVFAKLKADGNCEEVPDPFNVPPPDDELNELKPKILAGDSWDKLQKPIMEYINLKVNELCGKDISPGDLEDLYIDMANTDVRDELSEIERKIKDKEVLDSIIDSIQLCIQKAHARLVANGVCAAAAGEKMTPVEVINRIVTQPDDNEVYGEVFTLIQDLLKESDEDSKKTIGEYVEALVNALNANIKNMKLCSLICNILFEISKKQDGIDKLLEHKAEDALVNAINAPENDLDVFTAACQSISNIVASDVGKEASVAAKAPEAIVKAIQKHNKDEGACIYACMALDKIAEIPNGKEAVIDAGAPEKLANIYKENPDDYTKDLASKLLKKLDYDNDPVNVSPLFGPGNPDNFRKTRQSGGSRNRRVTPIGKKIGGISIKKRTPKSKKKSRSKK